MRARGAGSALPDQEGHERLRSFVEAEKFTNPNNLETALNENYILLLPLSVTINWP